MDPGHDRHRGARGPAGGGRGRPRARPIGRYLGAPVLDGPAALYRGHPAVDGRRRPRHADHRGRHRLAGHHVPLPGPEAVRMGAAAADGGAGLRHRLRLHRHSGICRAGAGAAARRIRLERQAGLLVPRDPIDGRRRLDDDAGALPLRLSAVARGVSRAVGLRARGQPDPGARAVAELLLGRPAPAGPWGAGRGGASSRSPCPWRGPAS